jgi:ATP-dependent DNA helicase RecG
MVALAESLAALANGQGGTLSLAAETGQTAALIDTIMQAALSIDPPLILPLPVTVPGSEPMSTPLSPSAVTEISQTVLVTVPAGMPHVYAVQGRYLISDGEHNRPLAPVRLRELLMARGEVGYEAEVVPHATADDLDWTAASVYAARIGMFSAQEALLRRGCLTLREGQLRPTVAGILLFGRDPVRFSHGAFITAARFAGLEAGDQFTRIEISGTLPDQIRRAESFLIDHMQRMVQLGETMVRAEQFEYPLEAAREIVINAVAHRDYSIHGDGIRLFLFADRLEVSSPGKLAGPVTVANIANERFSRNAIIVQVLVDMGFIERLGYGIDRILSLTRSRGLPAPDFSETAGGFRVKLSRAAPTPPTPINADISTRLGASDMSNLLDDLNPRQQTALDFLGTQSRITNHDLQTLYPFVHAETIRRDLADLVARGLLEKFGQKRGSYYSRTNGKRNRRLIDIIEQD